MLEFDLFRPQNLQEALDLLAEYKGSARVMAGGTDLMIALRAKKGMENVKYIIDISRLQELAYIREGEGLEIGPLATMTQVAESPVVRQCAGVLAAAASTVGSPQIRNRGTIGGNVVNAAVCADTVAPLVALEAKVKLERKGGSRWLPLDQFITGPNRTQLAADELMTGIVFAKLPANAGWGFMRLARREALAIARMNVAVVIKRDSQGKVEDASIVPGAVLPRPGRVTEAEKLLIGTIPDGALARRAGEAVAEAMISAAGRRWSTPYKEPAIIALTERAIKQALEVEWR
ncbi:MAG: FAD binding domain-containing protein [Bacillota bacterium]|jgi:CO/xanthine dehydrogenase FAD-binding subunit|nr:xanthine dehydrogenase family protein subunit M [Bacillota bacterium]HOC06973.1 FAD binding domain-containing protein [Bacillota bacterium]HPZ22605.1 FAD binding domain-containing protein [Bacillota bacterium]HQD20356.1 FAD binding domain-containing protein [Bacillota bacterium]